MNAAETATPLNLALIVEDCPDQAEILSIALERLGIGSWTAGTAKTMTAAVTRGRFDFIILDLNLPDSCGMKTMDYLLSICPDAVVIVVSGMCDETTIRACMDRGALAFICKGAPIAKQVEDAVQIVLNRLGVDKRHNRIKNGLCEARKAVQHAAAGLSNNRQEFGKM